MKLPHPLKTGKKTPLLEKVNFKIIYKWNIYLSCVILRAFYLLLFVQGGIHFFWAWNLVFNFKVTPVIYLISFLKLKCADSVKIHEKYENTRFSWCSAWGIGDAFLCYKFKIISWHILNTHSVFKYILKEKGIKVFSSQICLLNHQTINIYLRCTGCPMKHGNLKTKVVFDFWYLMHGKDSK